MNYYEIAESLGLRRTFVGVVLLRARHQLRDLLAPVQGADPKIAGVRGTP